MVGPRVLLDPDSRGSPAACVLRHRWRQYVQYTAFDDEHGTAVFGILNADDNGFGVTGIMPGDDEGNLPDHGTRLRLQPGRGSTTYRQAESQ